MSSQHIKFTAHCPPSSVLLWRCVFGNKGGVRTIPSKSLGPPGALQASRLLLGLVGYNCIADCCLYRPSSKRSNVPDTYSCTANLGSYPCTTISEPQSWDTSSRICLCELRLLPLHNPNNFWIRWHSIHHQQFGNMHHKQHTLTFCWPYAPWDYSHWNSQQGWCRNSITGHNMSQTD